MRVTVTGATGFIGRHVIPELLRSGAEVVAVSRATQSPFKPSERLTFSTLDMGEPGSDWFKLLGNPDVLLHLAWSGLPNYRSETHLQQELPRQMAFLSACVDSGLKRLVVTGTCLEYGMQSGMLSEDLPAMPCTAYGDAKTRLYQHLLELQSSCDFQLTWLRLFYLYGPGQAPTSLYSQLRTAIAERRSEFAMSAGDQLRDFLPVEKAAAHIREIALGKPGAGVVNICSGVPRAVSDIVQEWLRDWHAGIHIKLGVYPYPDYEPMAFWGSTQRLYSLLRTPC
ncbi:MAG TPA: NAD-dependent epimerase/dehydratase family protein [Gammaproteobacteria bacterium]|nr:NAD-dependent epimerase/dehydratase family protein [Gammaproteobacteria bacterium]